MRSYRYTTFDDDDLIWLDNYQHQREQFAEEHIQRKRAKKRRDRRYFGEELWFPFERHTSDRFLQKYDLPALSSEIALAEWLNIPLSRLRWFTHNRPAETVWHYHKTVVPKRSNHPCAQA